MGHKVTIKKVKHPRYDWRAACVEDGKWRQRYFKTKTAAKEWADERGGEARTHGTETTITSAERAAVVETRKELVEVGMDLREAVAFAASHSLAATIWQRARPASASGFAV